MRLEIVIIFLMFVYFERERAHVHTSVGGERESERIPSRLHAVSTEPHVGFNPMTLRSRPEPKSRVGGSTD